MNTPSRYHVLGTIIIAAWLVPNPCHADSWETAARNIAEDAAASIKKGDAVLFFCPTCGGWSSDSIRGLAEILIIDNVRVIPAQEDDLYRRLGYGDVYLVKLEGRMILRQEIEEADMPENNDDNLILSNSQCFDPRVRPTPPYPIYLAFNYHFVENSDKSFELAGSKFGYRATSGNRYNVPATILINAQSEDVIRDCRN